MSDGTSAAAARSSPRYRRRRCQCPPVSPPNQRHQYRHQLTREAKSARTAGPGRLHQLPRSPDQAATGSYTAEMVEPLTEDELTFLQSCWIRLETEQPAH